MQRALCAVAVLSLAFLMLRSARVGLAGDYVDPITKIVAQDEALYANSAIQMARGGGWLTPLFMGRYALYKPPLLIWTAAASARLFGITHLALRLPVALLCSLALGLVFLWVAELRSWQAGVCAVVLVLSNHLWDVLAGLCMTDGLLAAFYIGALYCLFADPWLTSPRALWGFAAMVAAAILTKSVAGILPLGALGVYWLASPPKFRPRLARVCLAGILSLALAAPWFVYQLVVHHRWFITEQVNVEILGFGAGTPAQTSQENHALFYLLRLAAIDPVLLAVALVALPGFLGELRKRSAPAVMLACWIALPLAAALGWQYRNVAYLLPIVPGLAILATAHGPYSSPKASTWMLAFAGAALALKAALPAAPSGISFAGGTVQPVAPLVSDYCERRRANELILVGMDDDLYATTLPLPKLRYALVGWTPASNPYAMPFDQMGIVLTAAQFDNLPALEPMFRDRLRQWGLNSSEPLGTLIAAATPGELAGIIRSHPSSDFLLPDRYRAAVEAAARASHEVIEQSGHLILLSRASSPGTSPEAPWTCRM